MALVRMEDVYKRQVQNGAAQIFAGRAPVGAGEFHHHGTVFGPGCLQSLVEISFPDRSGESGGSYGQRKGGRSYCMKKGIHLMGHHSTN